MHTSVLYAHTDGLWIIKELCIADEHLAFSCYLNLILCKRDQLCVTEHSLFCCCLLAACLFLYINAFLNLILKRVIFILCSDNFLIN